MNQQTPLPVPGGIRAVSLQSLVRGGRWRVETLHACPVHLVMWFTRGQGRSTIHGITRGYGPQTAIFIPAGTMHAVEIGPQVQGWALEVPPLADAGFPDEVIQTRVPDIHEQGELTRYLDAIATELRDAKPGHARVAASYVALVGVWLERRLDRNERAPKAGRGMQTLMRAFTAAVEREVTATRSVSDFARALSITPTHLSRACRAACGRPASELLQDRLMAEARRLLVDTDLKVRDVAARLGYSSPAYFTRCFTQAAGCPPSTFRTRARPALQPGARVNAQPTARAASAR